MEPGSHGNKECGRDVRAPRVIKEKRRDDEEFIWVGDLDFSGWGNRGGGESDLGNMSRRKRL
jgi:hypothetical protein